MGSFFTTCSISHSTITEQQKTTVQLLVPTSKYTSLDKGMIVSNDGSMAYFTPFGFPIHGEYNDYGRIAKYERDQNIDKLEEYFNLSIEDIMNSTSDDRWYVYGIERGDKDWGFKTLDGGEIRNIETLKILGSTNYRTEVYEYLIRDWVKLKDEITENPKNELNYYFNDWRKRINRFFDSYKMTNREKLIEKYGEKITRDLDEFILDKMETMVDLSSMSTFVSTICEYNMFKELKYDFNPWFEENYMKLHHFVMMYGGFGLNRIILPSAYGGQQENWSKLIDLNNFTNKLLEDDLKERLYEIVECDIDSYIDDNVFDLDEFKNDYGSTEVEVAIKIAEERELAIITAKQK